MSQNVHCPFCSSIYEDAPYNYLIDYALVNGGLPGIPTFAQFQGLDALGETMFRYQLPTQGCNTAYNSIPIHLESTRFPAVPARVQNLSTRGTVMTGDDVLINGFIITGPDPKTVVVRALGPSLGGFGLSGVLADPVLTVHNSLGAVIATNDNWQTDVGATFIAQNGLAQPIRLNQPLYYRTCHRAVTRWWLPERTRPRELAWPRFTKFPSQGLTPY
jgi:hypothetical protein